MVNLVDEESNEEVLKVASKNISKGAEPRPLKKVQASPTRETIPVSSFGVGDDGETVSEEAKLTEEPIPQSFTEQGKVLTTRRLPF
jgi:hypothetical protein